MPGYLLTAIEANPSEALELFLLCLKHFSDDFVKGSSLERYFLRSADFNCILSGENIVKITGDNIKEKIIDVIRKEIENNFMEFQQFLINPSFHRYDIFCQLDGCMTIIETMGKYYCEESCEYKFTIKKSRKNSKKFNGFYIQDFKPIIRYEKLLNKAKLIVQNPEKDHNINIYCDAANVTISLLEEYLKMPVLKDETDSLLEYLTASLNQISQIKGMDAQLFSDISAVFERLVHLYASIENTKKMAEILDCFAEFNLNTYFSSLITDESTAKQFYHNSIYIAHQYNNRHSVIEYARRSFEYIDKLGPSCWKHVYTLQEYMIKHLDYTRRGNKLLMNYAVSILEYMLHFVVTLSPLGTDSVIKFVNSEVEFFKYSPDKFFIILDTYCTRLVMFNKRFRGQYPELEELEEQLSDYIFEIGKSLEESQSIMADYSYPIDINGNFFNTVRPKKTYVEL